ncbi:MAG TPA: glycosyltransferase family 4 protein [Longimicrobium sp.]
MPRSESGRAPRVVFVTITFDPEPGALRGLPLARWLARRGYDVRVLTGFPQYPGGKVYPGYRIRPWQWETMDGIPVLRVPLYPSHDTRALRRIWTYLSFMLSAATLGVALVGRADVVYLYEPPPTNGLASLLLKWFRGAPVVHHIADMWPETVLGSGMLPAGRVQKVAERLIGAWCRFLYRRADVMSVLSPGFKRMLVERGVPAEKVEVIYNWTDEDAFRPVPRDPALARELGLDGKFNVIYAGNIGPLQGIDTVVRAAVLAAPRCPELQVTIVGTGPLSDEVRSLADELGATNVRFVPRREYWEMPQINALADVLLVHLRDFPFLASTIPSKTQVSLASGRPVLIGVRGDAADLVLQAGGGVAVPPEDPAAMADAMVELARMSPAERDAMGRRGREYYLRNLSLDIAGEQHDRIFRRLAAGRRRARARLGARGRESGD